ncbi:hypothetical protein [Candidatus Protochlamydia sp. W-9]|uniref:hypothetical protein n=1 Tax=Candidatus Protochlamydia sp. W-9 TaxID=1785087 RepID=UPI000A52C048|nr:hypothetical protein [Candidatus Protochlamydia sp. W-9]
MISSLAIDDINSFSLLALTQDEKTLISVSLKKEMLSSKTTNICLWQIDFKDQILLQITLEKKKIITGLAKKASYAPQTSIIALYVLERSCVEFYLLPDLELKQNWTLQLLKGKKEYKVSNMVFTPQESQLIVNILPEKISRLFSGKIPIEFKSKVYSWDIKNKQKKSYFLKSTL